MTTPHAFSEAERAAVYRAIRERRDVRRFRPDPVPDEVVRRLLAAAAHAPSVGYMQPWNFILVRDLGVRRQVHEAFGRANAEAQALFPPERRDRYAALKLEGILDAALNVCVTCDRGRFGPVVLGRTCQPDMDLYSAVCAVQNLWLAARAEGVGVGWVSILDRPAVEALLGLPQGVQLVAYLCVGYPVEFRPRPMLEEVGWKSRQPLGELVFQDRWGVRSSLFQ